MKPQRLEKDKHATQRDRWRARLKPNNSLTFAHALLFSAAAAMIGGLFTGTRVPLHVSVSQGSWDTATNPPLKVRSFRSRCKQRSVQQVSDLHPDGTVAQSAGGLVLLGGAVCLYCNRWILDPQHGGGTTQVQRRPGHVGHAGEATTGMQ